MAAPAVQAFDAVALLLDDELNETPAAEFGGRFACSECADNRDAAEAAERDLAAAMALLRLILRADLRPAKAEGRETPAELAAIGYAQAFAAIRARIELYLAARR